MFCKPFFLKHNSAKSFSSSSLKSHGFTLVELLIVIAILGILATSFIVLINPKSQIDKSTDAHRKSDLKQIQAALELYRADNGDYPSDGSDGTVHAVANCNQSLVDNCLNIGATYIQTVPKDPSKVNYYYDQVSLGTYSLYSCADNKSDPDAISAPSSVDTAMHCSSTKYFKVTNP